MAYKNDQDRIEETHNAPRFFVEHPQVSWVVPTTVRSILVDRPVALAGADAWRSQLTFLKDASA